ncbi:hypothetical protein AUJ16_01335 [Candidatus Micrarchaeota archaeon CG1_02_60_51]|nr:MAG: hypothetical protein AUJ16_01335 [Candidatus Micrarchaeota archaeon CG1_02_60_51]
MFSFKPDEFVVEEITSDGTILEIGKQFDFGKPEDQPLERNYFTRFVLQKREWNTAQALSEMARALHIRPPRFDSAGTKDRQAVTTQQCSAFAVPPASILALRLKDLQINGAWKATAKVRLGDLQGNRFTITLNKENCGVEPDAKAIAAKAAEHGYLFKNYFGYQRFGSNRENTADMGLHILRGELKEACLNYLAFQGGERSPDAREARARLAKEGDYAAALGYFPRWLKYERLLLEPLAVNQNDYAGALRRLPRNILLLFVHAFQAKLFNERLRAYAGEWDESLEGNLVGTGSQPTPEEQALLDGYGLSAQSFSPASMPELSCKGNRRKLFARMNGFALLSESPVTLRFSLDSGCYATTALEYLLGQQH